MTPSQQHLAWRIYSTSTVSPESVPPKPPTHTQLPASLMAVLFSSSFLAFYIPACSDLLMPQCSLVAHSAIQTHIITTRADAGTGGRPGTAGLSSKPYLYCISFPPTQTPVFLSPITHC